MYAKFWSENLKERVFKEPYHRSEYNVKMDAREMVY
jgi:hypothetical protein